jgi:predicted nuclease of predicted toxin-antitoxin system
MISPWRLFLDQNVRLDVRDILRTRSSNVAIDVIHSSEVLLQRALDPEILHYTINDNRVLVTHDYDFGDQNIFPLPAAHPGLIRLRIKKPLPSIVAERLIQFLETHRPDDIRNCLVIISENKLRIQKSIL